MLRQLSESLPEPCLRENKQLRIQTAIHFEIFSSVGAWHCKLLFDQGLNVETCDVQPNANENDGTSHTKLKERRMRARPQSRPTVRALAHSGRRKF